MFEGLRLFDLGNILCRGFSKHIQDKFRPACLGTHLNMLAECGFTGIDVVYKYYNYAVLFATAK